MATIKNFSALTILMVSRSTPFHSLGGMEAVAWDLALAFTKAGHSVSLLTTEIPNQPANSTRDGIEIICLPVKAGRYSNKWWTQSLNYYEANLQNKFDVIFSVSAGALKIAKFRGRRSESAVFIAQSHGTTLSEIRSKIALKKPTEWLKALYISNRLVRDSAYKYFDHIITIGNRVTADHKEWPIKNYTKEIPITEVVNGVDTDQFCFSPASRSYIRDKYNIPERTLVILTAARLHPQKGIQQSIDTVKSLVNSEKEICYIVVGDGPARQNLEDHVSALDLQQKVIFAGAVDRANMQELYSAADLFLFTTTRIEGLPLNVLEALACGLPTFLSQHVIIEGQKHIISVDPHNPEKTAAQIRDFMTAWKPESRTNLLDEQYTLAFATERYLGIFSRELDRQA